jgi:hypothetical protein
LISANYFVLDGARLDANLLKALSFDVQQRCLYQGKSSEDLEFVAPYLVRYIPGSPFAEWLYQNSMGESWGVFIQTVLPFEEIYRHLRKFLLVNTEDGKELYFRFYDPRVLRIFLPTCSSSQLKLFFGPINSFIVESETKGVFSKYWLENYNLKFTEIVVELDDSNEQVSEMSTTDVNNNQDFDSKEQFVGAKSEKAVLGSNKHVEREAPFPPKKPVSPISKEKDNASGVKPKKDTSWGGFFFE